MSLTDPFFEVLGVVTLKARRGVDCVVSAVSRAVVDSSVT